MSDKSSGIWGLLTVLVLYLKGALLTIASFMGTLHFLIFFLRDGETEDSDRGRGGERILRLHTQLQNQVPDAQPTVPPTEVPL